MSQSRETIANFLEDIGRALSSGNAEAAARAWEIPALVLSQEGALAITDLDEVEALFVRAINWYRARGEVSTRPEIEDIEDLDARISSVDVRWPGYDATGAERSSERSRYVIRLDDEGRPRIRVAIGLPPGA
jgi:hypothetical protein